MYHLLLYQCIIAQILNAEAEMQRPNTETVQMLPYVTSALLLMREKREKKFCLQLTVFH